MCVLCGEVQGGLAVGCFGGAVDFVGGAGDEEVGAGEVAVLCGEVEGGVAGGVGVVQGVGVVFEDALEDEEVVVEDCAAEAQGDVDPGGGLGGDGEGEGRGGLHGGSVCGKREDFIVVRSLGKLASYRAGELTATYSGDPRLQEPQIGFLSD